jgi:hypothetical protein
MLDMLAEFLDAPRWLIECKKGIFFKRVLDCLDVLTQERGYVVLECSSIDKEVEQVLVNIGGGGYAFHAKPMENPDYCYFFIPWTLEAKLELLKLAEKHAGPEICDHLIYINKMSRPLLLWFDVCGSTDFVVRPFVHEEIVSKIAQIVGGVYRLEQSL